MIKSIRYFLLMQCMVWVGMVMAAHKHNPKGTAAWCGSEVPSMTWESQLQRIIQHQKSMPGNKQQSATYNIPVVVHVVYYNSAQNISAAQVQSQITVLNNDFAGTGLNSNSIPAPFAPLLANTNITFCLAKLSPANTILPEPGIDRIDARAKGWPNPGATGWTTNFIDNTIKKTTIWDPNFYLNIWVVPAIRSTTGGITLGYATFPSLTGLDGLPTDPGNDLNDGFVCRADFFGTTGSASASKGRTSTHEIGHWLGLRHIWGDDSCGTDFVDDTPTALKENYNCPVFPHRTCENTSSGDMFMNFMDYTDDDCMALFTLDQKQRMNTTLQFGDFRKNLINSPVCDTTKQIPFARFDYELSPFSSCATSKSYNFTDRSTFAPKSWSWTFEGGNPASSNLQNPTGIVFNTPGLHNVTLVVTNAVGTHTITKTINVSLVGSTVAPLLEDFESPVFPPVGWVLINRNGNPLINWEVIEGYSAYGIGNKSLKFNNTEYDAKGKRDDIVSPKINFTGITSAYIKFDVAYTPYFGPLVAGGPNENIFDTLEVHITDNCLNTTQLVYRKGGNSLATFLPGIGDEFYPAPNQWRRDSIALPAAYLNKENIQIVFRNLGNYGHSIYVDNINISPVVSLPTATASFTVSDTVVCPAGTLRFTNTSTATVGSPDSIRWTFQGGSLATATTSPVDVVFNTPGTYTISLIAYKSGLPSAAATKTIRVKSNPTVTVTSPTICSGGTATLTAGGADSYTWTGGLSAVSNPTTPVLNSNATYTVTGTTNGCSATALSTVTVKAKPNVTITPDQQVCSGDSVVLTASGATSYQWNAGNPNNTASITVFPTGVSTYTVIGTTNGCTDTASTNITIKSKPTVTVTSSPICAGNTATLQASGATTY
ncbi:MAG TPA: M43 family zinc metalloprotease, partial [Chitinophagales bacterium]|nr:M43 family zinc metalloprotease [Chitinophagales bacterium]